MNDNEERRTLWRMLGEAERILGLPWDADRLDWEGTPDNEPAPPMRDLKHVLCPQCRRPFAFIWNDYTTGPDVTFNGRDRETLIVRGCPSGGVYDVSIHCPHCTYEEEL